MTAHRNSRTSRATSPRAKWEDKSKAIDKLVRELQSLADQDDVNVLGLVRRGKRVPGAARDEAIRAGDVVVLEGGPQSIERFMGATGLEYAGSQKHGGVAGETLALVEVVVPQGARIARSLGPGRALAVPARRDSARRLASRTTLS